MRLKILDMRSKTDQQILLSYFFKKTDTVVDKEELLTVSSFYYNSEEEKLYSLTKRFATILAPYTEKKISNEDIHTTLQNALSDFFKIHEEVVRCDLYLQTRIDSFYITVIGADFYQVESSHRKKRL